MLLTACSAFIEPEDVTCDCADTDEEVIQEMIDAASDTIAILTGGVIMGLCEDHVIPRSMSGGYCIDNHWGYACTCGHLSGITLRGPNPDIQAISLHGEDFTDFAIIDDRTLVRTDGMGWPVCQSITDPSLEIEYTYGILPWLAKQAAAEIVCWFLANPPQAKQKLPTGTRGVNIAGVQITLESMLTEVKKNTLLLPNVSKLLIIYGGPQQAVVYSPELEDGWQLHRVRYSGT